MDPEVEKERREALARNQEKEEKMQARSKVWSTWEDQRYKLERNLKDAIECLITETFAKSGVLLDERDQALEEITRGKGTQ